MVVISPFCWPCDVGTGRSVVQWSMEEGIVCTGVSPGMGDVVEVDGACCCSWASDSGARVARSVSAMACVLKRRRWLEISFVYLRG